MKIVLAGGTGYLGVLLQEHLKDNNEVYVLSRSKSGIENKVKFIIWDGKTTAGDWVDVVLKADVVFNLSGRTVDCRYNETNKRQIIESRTLSTAIIGKVLSDNPSNVKTWINFSSATIYEYTETEDMTEGSKIGSGFSVEVCQAWEKAFYKSELPQIRKIALRLSMVMGKDNGPLVPLTNLTKLWLGGKQGSGSQYVAWLSEPDFINIVDYVLANEQIKGSINTCSPNPIPNHAFMKCIRKAYKRSFGMPLQTWMLEIGAFFLRTETELVTKSRRVVPQALLDDGFEFEYPHFQGYVNHLARGKD